MNRRDFMRRTAGGAAMGLPLAEAAQAQAPSGPETQSLTPLDLKTLPVFCAHEHWGSIDSIGTSEEGYRADTEAGALPSRETSVWDLVLDPYFGGFLRAAGADPLALARAAGAKDFLVWWQRAPESALSGMRPHLEAQALTGAFQCIRRGIQQLYGADIGTFELEAWRRADASVSKAYADVHAWYRAAMEQTHLSEVVRPVHPEFYVRKGSDASARAELAFTHSILRIDPLLHLEARHCPRREGLAAMVGVEPRDARSWRAFLDKLFNLAAANGSVGIKQLQAYGRSLDFAVRSEAEIRWRGALTREQTIALQDWIVHECCKQAHERGWAHQVHVGTHNLEQSSPLPLGALAERYPKMNIVMLHCWPFLSESGWLAKRHPNVYIDTCWQAVLNPAFYRRSLAEWLGYVPAHKIMCSQDATSVEMAAGSSLFVREILGESLRFHGDGLLGEAEVMGIAQRLLHNNAVRLYRVGTEA